MSPIVELFHIQTNNKIHSVYTPYIINTHLTLEQWSIMSFESNSITIYTRTIVLRCWLKTALCRDLCRDAVSRTSCTLFLYGANQTGSFVQSNENNNRSRATRKMVNIVGNQKAPSRCFTNSLTDATCIHAASALRTPTTRLTIYFLSQKYFCPILSEAVLRFLFRRSCG